MADDKTSPETDAKDGFVLDRQPGETDAEYRARADHVDMLFSPERQMAMRAATDRALNEEAMAMPPSPAFDAAARAAARRAGLSEEEIDDMFGPDLTALIGEAERENAVRDLARMDEIDYQPPIE